MGAVTGADGSGITVRGRAEALADPTEARLVVSVSARDPAGPAEAVDRAAVAAAAVDDVLGDGRDGGSGVDLVLVRRVVTSSVRTSPVHQHGPQGPRVVGWAAERRSDVVAAPDGPGLTALIDRLARIADVRVDGPRWHVAPEDEVWTGLRAGAAGDARRRAEGYAAALGVQVGVVRSVVEPEHARWVEQQAGGVLRAQAVDDGGAALRAVRVAVEPVEVAVEVVVTFEIA